MNLPIVVLISGSPGTGKTSIRRQTRKFFLEKIGETAAISADDVYNMVDSDFSEVKSNHPNHSALAENNIILLIKNFISNGFKLILIEGNGLYEEKTVNKFWKELSEVANIFHFTLDTKAEILVERVEKRGDLQEHNKEWLMGWQNHIRKYYNNKTCVIDNSNQSTKETLEQIYNSLLEKQGLVNNSR